MEVWSQPISDGVVRIAASGEIDMATVDDLSRALQAAVLLEGCTAVVLDLADVTFCDSSGLSALDSAHARGARRGTTLRLVNVQPQVRRVLELMDMLDTLTAGEVPEH